MYKISLKFKNKRAEKKYIDYWNEKNLQIYKFISTALIIVSPIFSLYFFIYQNDLQLGILTGVNLIFNVTHYIVITRFYPQHSVHIITLINVTISFYIQFIQFDQQYADGVFMGSIISFFQIIYLISPYYIECALTITVIIGTRLQVVWGNDNNNFQLMQTFTYFLFWIVILVWWYHKMKISKQLFLNQLCEEELSNIWQDIQKEPQLIYQWNEDQIRFELQKANKAAEDSLNIRTQNDSLVFLRQLKIQKDEDCEKYIFTLIKKSYNLLEKVRKTVQGTCRRENTNKIEKYLVDINISFKTNTIITIVIQNQQEQELISIYKEKCKFLLNTLQQTIKQNLDKLNNLNLKIVRYKQQQEHKKQAIKLTFTRQQLIMDNYNINSFFLHDNRIKDLKLKIFTFQECLKIINSFQSYFNSKRQQILIFNKLPFNFIMQTYKAELFTMLINILFHVQKHAAQNKTIKIYIEQQSGRAGRHNRDIISIKIHYCMKFQTNQLQLKKKPQELKDLKYNNEIPQDFRLFSISQSLHILGPQRNLIIKNIQSKIEQIYKFNQKINLFTLKFTVNQRNQRSQKGRLKAKI